MQSHLLSFLFIRTVGGYSPHSVADERVTILEAMVLVAAGNGQESIYASKLPLTERLSCAGLGDHLFPLPCTSLSYPSRQVLKNLVCVTSAAAAPSLPFPSGLVVKIHACRCVWNVVHRFSRYHSTTASHVSQCSYASLSPQTPVFSHMSVPVS